MCYRGVILQVCFVASISNSFHPLTCRPELSAGVFPSSAICGFTKLYCILLPSASAVFTVFQPRCTFTLSRSVPLSLSILLLFACCFLIPQFATWLAFGNVAFIALL